MWPLPLTSSLAIKDYCSRKLAEPCAAEAHSGAAPPRSPPVTTLQCWRVKRDLAPSRSGSDNQEKANFAMWWTTSNRITTRLIFIRWEEKNWIFCKKSQEIYENKQGRRVNKHKSRGSRFHSDSDAHTHLWRVWLRASSESDLWLQYLQA